MGESGRPPSNVLAGIFSFLVPGAGQMYKGRVMLGAMWLAATLLAYCTLILPGVLVHFLCVFQAAGMEARRARA